MAKALIVLNPVAGGGKYFTKFKQELIEYEKKEAKQPFELVEWSKAEEWPLIETKIKQGNYERVIAAGGDGTMNAVAKTLIGSRTALGIVPMGSGNGLARHLHIPLDLKPAIALSLEGPTQAIDIGQVNERSFLCTSGVGFDALIGHAFAGNVKRGLSTYVKLCLQAFNKYIPLTYHIQLDGKQIERNAFLVTIANAAQYGNNAYIAPEASVKDGYLHVSIMRSFKWWEIPFLAFSLFNKTILRTNYVESFIAKEVLLSGHSNGFLHMDGEPVVDTQALHYRVIPSALNVVCNPQMPI